MKIWNFHVTKNDLISAAFILKWNIDIFLNRKHKYVIAWTAKHIIAICISIVLFWTKEHNSNQKPADMLHIPQDDVSVNNEKKKLKTLFSPNICLHSIYLTTFLD